MKAPNRKHLPDQPGKRMPDPPEAEFYAAICKALSHPVRVRILSYLDLVEDCICGQIVELLPLAQSTVSQHLKVLKRAGLIRGRIEGPRTCYCIDRDTLARFKVLTERL